MNLMAETGLLGREAVLASTEQDLAKGRHILLTGPHGIGKSALLQTIAERYAGGKLLVRVHDHHLKAQLTELAQALIEAGWLDPGFFLLPAVPENLTADQRRQLRQRQLTRLSTLELMSILPACLEQARQQERHALLLVDDWSYLQPAHLPYVCRLLEHVQAVATCRICRPALQKLWWQMKILALDGLAEHSSRQLAASSLKPHISDAKVLGRCADQLARQAAGNPQMLAQMLQELRQESLLDRQQVLMLDQHSTRRYADATPILLIVAASVVISRFIALGLGDRLLYILSGIGVTMVLLARQLWQRHRRRRC